MTILTDSKQLSSTANYNSILKGQRDNNDCAVVAISLATSTPYNRVYRLLANLGRRLNGRTKREYTERAIDYLGYELKTISCEAKTIRGLKTELVFLPPTCLVFTRGHVLCASNYKIYDWTDDRLHRITKIQEVVEKTEVEF